MRVFPSESGVQTRPSNHVDQMPFRTAVVQTWGANLRCKPSKVAAPDVSADAYPQLLSRSRNKFTEFADVTCCLSV